MRAEVKNPMHALPRGRFHPHHRDASARGQGLDLRQRIPLIARAVLKINERPFVTSGSHQLGRLGRAEREKATQHGLSLCQPLSKGECLRLGPELVCRCGHSRPTILHQFGISGAQRARLLSLLPAARISRA